MAIPDDDSKFRLQRRTREIRAAEKAGGQNNRRTYIDGVMGRADHHAKSVEGVALALAGAIVWRNDDGTEIEVKLGKSGGSKRPLGDD